MSLHQYKLVRNLPTHQSIQTQMISILKISLLVALVLSTLASADSSLYKKILNTIDPEAKCLDGTPGLLYTHQGTQTDKFIIFFEGGGMCGDDTLPKTIENCYKRSKTLLGSSTLWPDTLEGQGYLSTDPAKNEFANWTKIIFGYCDGALHQGSTKAPLKYKDTQLYFRGANITRAHFKFLQQKYNISSASSIVLTGSSAGALGALYWTNYLQSMVKKPSIVSTIADSGIFMNAKVHESGALKIQTEIINLYKVANADQHTPIQICNAFYNGSQWKCLFVQYSYAAIEGRLLLINSEYDSYAIPNILGINCLKAGKSGVTLSSCTATQHKQIEKYRDQYKNFVFQFLQFSKNNIWSIGCANHVYACLNNFYDVAEQKVPANIGNRVRDAVRKFVFDKTRIADIDTEQWPANNPCAY